MTRFKNILVPIDFSDASRAALTYARDLVDRSVGGIHLLHVVPEVSLGLGAADVPAVALGDVEKQWQHQAQDELRDLLSESDVASIKVRREVRPGHPFVEIVRYAKTWDIDVIVVGTHGRGAVGHMLLGSVAENVVRKAPCPVLTIRHPGRAEREPAPANRGPSGEPL